MITTKGDRVSSVRTESGWSGDFDAVASNADVVRTYEMLGTRRAPGFQEAQAQAFLAVPFRGAFLSRGAGPTSRTTASFSALATASFSKKSTVVGIAARPLDLPPHPTATDPSMAPPGRSTFYALAPVPHLGRTTLDWDVEGPRYAKRMLEIIEQRVMPGLGERLGIVFHFGRPTSNRTEFAPWLRVQP